MCRALVSSSDVSEELNVSEHIRKQVIQAGLHYLNDIDQLRESVASRNLSVDLNKLVSCKTLSVFLLYYSNRINEPQ